MEARRMIRNISMNWISISAVTLGAAMTASCGGAPEENIGETQAALGEAIQGTNAGQFATAKANFELTETVQDGAGPIFNERSCSACHSNGTTGGAGQNIERRYGRLNAQGTFDG